jgi:hypothetical protein
MKPASSAWRALLLALLILTPLQAQEARHLTVADKLPTLPGQQTSELVGPSGLVLVVFRSADW